MTTTVKTPDTTETAAAADRTPDTATTTEEQKSARPSRRWFSPLPARGWWTSRTGLRLRGLALRLLVAAFDVVVVLTTATWFVPQIGLWIHATQGINLADLTNEGVIALWVAPFAFLVIMVAAAEFIGLRTLWRWASRHIERAREQHFDQTTTEASPTVETVTTTKGN